MRKLLLLIVALFFLAPIKSGAINTKTLKGFEDYYSCVALSQRGIQFCFGVYGDENRIEAEDGALRTCEISCEERCVIYYCSYR